MRLVNTFHSIDLPYADPCPWLTSDIVIYVDNRMWSDTYRSLVKDSRSLFRLFHREGLSIIFMPCIAEQLGADLVRYFGDDPSLDCQPESFRGIIPQVVLDQITQPTFVRYIAEEQTFHLLAVDMVGNGPDKFSFISDIIINILCRYNKPTSPQAQQQSTHPDKSLLGNLKDVCCKLFCEEEEADYETFDTAGTYHTEEEIALAADEENLRLLREMSAIWDRLQASGLSRDLIVRLMQGPHQPIPLHITSEQIALGKHKPYRNLRLGTMERAFYIFMLLHPEGIEYKTLVDHRDELYKIYRALGPRGRLTDHQDTIDHFVDSTTNSPSISASRIKRAITAVIADEISEPYLITGDIGAAKSIPLDRYFVHWDDHTLVQALGIPVPDNDTPHRSSAIDELIRKMAEEGSAD